jgi:hypothetical protein
LGGHPLVSLRAKGLGNVIAGFGIFASYFAGAAPETESPTVRPGKPAASK